MVGETEYRWMPTSFWVIPQEAKNCHAVRDHHLPNWFAMVDPGSTANATAAAEYRLLLPAVESRLSLQSLPDIEKDPMNLLFVWSGQSSYLEHLS